MDEEKRKEMEKRYPDIDFSKVSPEILALGEDVEDIVAFSKGEKADGVTKTTVAVVEKVVFCPAHDDTKPSAMVGGNGTAWHCAACGKSGPMEDGKAVLLEEKS